MPDSECFRQSGVLDSADLMQSRVLDSANFKPPGGLHSDPFGQCGLSGSEGFLRFGPWILLGVIAALILIGVIIATGVCKHRKEQDHDDDSSDAVACFDDASQVEEDMSPAP
jgi:hypothetical protein